MPSARSSPSRTTGSALRKRCGRRDMAELMRGVPEGADSMTRADLIADLATSNPRLCQADVELIVLTIFGDIASALARGQWVELRGFGVFTARRRGARLGRNPGTGETVPMDAKAVPLFSKRSSEALV
jgi:integration host factor subunit beta